MKNLLLFFSIATFSNLILAQSAVTNSFSGKDQIELHPAKVIEVKGWALNSNFILPAVMYHFNSNKAVDGTFSYFNSAGAGVGLSWGRIKFSSKNDNKITDTTFSEDIDIEMKNVFSFNFGFLFSSQELEGETVQLFAPTLSFGLLDFQLGIGYDLGNVSGESSRWFTSVSYNIPLSKLSDKGSYVLSKFKFAGTTRASGKSSLNMLF